MTRHSDRENQARISLLTQSCSALPASFPELVEPGPPDDEGGVELEAVRPEHGVLEELYELLDVSLQVHVWQVGHHVGHHLGGGRQGRGVGC